MLSTFVVFQVAACGVPHSYQAPSSKPTDPPTMPSSPELEDALFITSYNDLSKMHAVLSDHGKVAFVYLHEPSDDPSMTGPVRSGVVAYNRIPLINVEDVQKHRPEPPPLAVGYGTEEAVIENPNDVGWSFVWSKSGESVVLYKGKTPWCLLRVNDKRGFSRAIKMSGPWGEPWSDDAMKNMD